MARSKNLIIIFSGLFFSSTQAMEQMEVDNEPKIVQIFNNSNAYLENYSALLSDNNLIFTCKFRANDVITCYRCIRTHGAGSKLIPDNLHYFDLLKAEFAKSSRKRKSQITKEEQLIKKNYNI